MYISDFELVDILRDKMGEKEARSLVEYIEVRVEHKYVEASKVFATKEDLLLLEMNILKQIAETNQRLEVMRGENNQKLEILKGELNEKIAGTNEKIAGTNEKIATIYQKIEQTKSELLKWMFVFTLSSTVAIISTVLAAMKIIGW